MNKTIQWTNQDEPVGLSIDQLLYRIRQGDSKEGLIFDSVTMADIVGEDGVELFAFDALVFTYSLLRRKMDILLRTMNRATSDVEVAEMQISDPFKRNGVAQVAAVFELTDGQTVSVYFHNPDSTPGRLAPKDEMISWKWLLNKKDITIVVAPERGNDIAIREVARRVMKLASKNSAAFAKTNAKRAERLENISNMKTEINDLEVELDDLNKQIEVARVEKESEALKPQVTAADGMSALESIKQFLGRGQYRTISKAMQSDEKAFFVDKARVLADIINNMAETYDQDGKGMDATVFLHYFKGGSDWYITEKDVQGGTRQAFGYSDLGKGGELGYISIDELTKNEVELDLHFDPKALSAIITAPAEPAGEDNRMAEARTMVSDVVAEFEGASLAQWTREKDDGNALADWDYNDLTIAGTTVRVGVSLGGVVSLDGKPHDAEGRVIDSNDSLRSAIAALLPKSDNASIVDKAHLFAMLPEPELLPDPNDSSVLYATPAVVVGSTEWRLTVKEGVNAPRVTEFQFRKAEGDTWLSESQHPSYDNHKFNNNLPAGIAKIYEAYKDSVQAKLGESSKPEAPQGDTQAPAITVGDDVIMPEGSESKVKTAKGTEIATGFTVMEADKIIASHDSMGGINPDYPQELQPRDRGRSSSIAWVKKVSKSLDPDSLGKTRRADSGAPILGPDGVVESGNGRTMAIQEAYRSGDAGEYREWLEDEAEYFGLDAEKVKAMKAPVLVRIRTSSIDRRAFAVEANQDDKLAMTGTEKAKADADRLDMSLMSKLSDDGDLLSRANRDFILGFLASLGDAESAQYMTTDGNPTGALISRIQAAIFAKAYNDDRLLELSADVSRPEVANIVAALNVAAPEFILARAADEDGSNAVTGQIVDSVEASMNEQAVQAIIEATNLVKKSRAEGTSVEEAISQLGLFGDIPPATAAMALFINANNRSAKRLGVAFKAMAEFVKSEAEKGQTIDMFGESSQVTLQQILDAANRKLEQEYGEGAYAIESMDMFSADNMQPEPTAEPATDEADQFKNIFSEVVEDLRSPDTSEAVIVEPEPEPEAQVEPVVEPEPVLEPTVEPVIEPEQAPDLPEAPADNVMTNLNALNKLVSKGPIKSDDPGAIDKLNAKLNYMQAFASMMRTANKHVRKNDDVALALMGFNEKTIEALKKPDFAGRIGFADYEMSNNTAEIGRTKRRLKQLYSEQEAAQAEASPEPIEAPVVEPVVEPVEAPVVEEPEQQSTENEDKSFLESVINGTVEDILSPELGEKIEAVLERNVDNVEMAGTLEKAVMAYQAAMEQATSEM